MPDALDRTHHPPQKDAQSKVPKRVDLSGCTFEGKQLSAAELEERERRSEYMEAHRKQIADNVVILRRRHTKATGTEVDTRKVSKRAKRFTSNEIRKEYGIMKKPYPTKIENLLWCIVNKGPIDMRGIAEVFEIKDFREANSKFSGPLSHLYSCLGRKKPWNIGWITRESEAGRYFYSAAGEGLDKSVEVLYAKYLSISAKIYAEKKAKKQGKPADPAADVQPEKPEPYVNVDLNGIQNIIQGAVIDAVEKTLGIQIEVSGKVEILFGWKREKL